MCPSFRATGEEEHSTRGRARLLHEMLAGEVVTDGWRSEEVRDALDLCLSCKGCRRDCPVGVDMATYKAEFLHHHYAGRLPPGRPLRDGPAAACGCGWRRRCAPARLVNALAAVRPLAALAKRLGGIAPERDDPAGGARRRSAGGGGRQGARADGLAGPYGVVLWPDTFTDHLSPSVGQGGGTRTGGGGPREVERCALRRAGPGLLRADVRLDGPARPGPHGDAPHAGH